MGGPRKPTALAWVALLWAGPAEAKFAFDWLHVPKTGTSFALPQLFHTCEHLEKYFVGKDLDMGTLPLNSWLKRMTNHSDKGCFQNHGHTPLRGGLDQGHSGYRVDHVVTMLRAPTGRAASGFAYNLHDCHALHKERNKTWPGVLRFCTGLQRSLVTPERTYAEDVLLAYGKCVAGCQTNMITGKPCAHVKSQEESKKVAAARLERAKTKLDGFAFVGITERWAQSLCLWEKVFPRRSGAPYPSFYSGNTRPSPTGPTCSSTAARLLQERGYRDDADEAIYAYAVKIFEEKLAAVAPECLAIGSAAPSTLPPTLL